MLKCLAKNSNSLVQNCQTLQVLNLSCCEGLNLQLIQQIVDNCVELTEVTFDKISMIQNFDRSLASGNNILPEGYRIVFPLISYPDWIWNEFLIASTAFSVLETQNYFSDFPLDILMIINNSEINYPATNIYMKLWTI